MSQMSKMLQKATQRVVRLAADEGFHIVGFAVPKDLDNGEFGWSLFTSCPEPEANELTITIGEILKETIKPQNVN